MFYRCNPFKNRYCGKKDCYVYGGKCHITSRPDSSIDGMPLTDRDPGNHVTKEQEKIAKRFFKKDKSKEEE